MTEEIDKLTEITKKIDSLSKYTMKVSDNILNHLENPGLKEDKTDPVQQDKINKMSEQITKIGKTLHSIEDQVKLAKTPSPPSFSKKALTLCAIVSLSTSILSVASMHFLTQKNRYELGPNALQTCRKGRMLEKAWPKLTPKEREKITGVPPTPNKPSHH